MSSPGLTGQVPGFTGSPGQAGRWQHGGCQRDRTKL